MAEDFYKFIEKARKQPLEEKLKQFGQIIEKIMHLTLRIPALFDVNMIDINERIDTIETELHLIDERVLELEGQINVQSEKKQEIKTGLEKKAESKIPKGLKKPEDLKPPDQVEKKPIRKQSTRSLLMDELRKMFSQNVEGILKNEIDDKILIQFSEDKEILIPKSKIHSKYKNDTEMTQTFLIEAEILRKNDIID